MKTEKLEESQGCQARGRLHALPQTETGKKTAAGRKSRYTWRKNQRAEERLLGYWVKSASKMVCYSPARGWSMAWEMNSKSSLQFFMLQTPPGNTRHLPSPRSQNPLPAPSSQRSRYKPKPRKKRKTSLRRNWCHKNRMWTTLTHEKRGLRPSGTRKHTLTNTLSPQLCLVFTANCNLRLSRTKLHQRPATFTSLSNTTETETS